MRLQGQLRLCSRHQMCLHFYWLPSRSSLHRPHLSLSNHHQNVTVFISIAFIWLVPSITLVNSSPIGLIPSTLCIYRKYWCRSFRAVCYDCVNSHWKLTDVICFWNILLRARLLHLLCTERNFGKIWCACGQHQIQYTKWRLDNYMCSYIYNVTCVFVCTSCEIKIYW